MLIVTAVRHVVFKIIVKRQNLKKIHRIRGGSDLIAQGLEHYECLKEPDIYEILKSSRVSELKKMHRIKPNAKFKGIVVIRLSLGLIFQF